LNKPLRRFSEHESPLKHAEFYEISVPTIVDFEVDETGDVSRDLDNPEVDDSMDAVVASLVN
jgi:hypothetical protein